MPDYPVFFIIKLIFYSRKGVLAAKPVPREQCRNSIFQRPKHDDHPIELPFIAAFKQKRDLGKDRNTYRRIHRFAEFFHDRGMRKGIEHRKPAFVRKQK